MKGCGRVQHFSGGFTATSEYANRINTTGKILHFREVISVRDELVEDASHRLHNVHVEERSQVHNRTE